MPTRKPTAAERMESRPDAESKMEDVGEMAPKVPTTRKMPKGMGPKMMTRKGR